MIVLKINIKQLYFLFVIVFISLLIELIKLFPILSDSWNLWAVSFCVSSVYFLSLSITFRSFNFNWTHPIVIFVGMLGLFIYNRFILHFLGLTNIIEPNFMDFTPLRVEDVFLTARILCLFLIFYCISIVFILEGKGTNLSWSLKYNKFYFQCGLLFMLVGLIPAYFIQYKIYLDFIKGGYLNVFINQDFYSPPLYIKFPAMFFRLGFFLVLISIPPRNIFKVVFLIFMPFVILSLMTGIRGYYFSFLLTILFYYCNVISTQKIRFKTLGYIVITVVLLGDFFASYRLGLVPFSTGFNLFYTFVYDQGTSILALIHAVSLKSQGILDGSFINFFDVILSPDLMLQDKVDMLISPEAKKLGFSFGGSIFQESYLIGGFGLVILLGFFIPVFLNILINSSKNNRLLLAFLLMALPNIIFSPRSRMLDFVLKNITYFIVFIIIFYLIYIVRRRLENTTYSS
ncbi:O-antigen polysaccharide polymerase Wzy [Vibrio navarrensis]|uniref:O-antigen polysaccharide polymerase Wzy n=1 Tax=Vibrio navarrensis TaxID=29495 RepID=UPI00186A6B6B|nr:O-antigen polysaccharide polymerase Wzy [Vibrio navarrensis]MBE4618703.1 hypothetical protein [Vibrio navarrensis]